MTAYLDCNATTPVEPAVLDELLRFTAEEYGNAGSRTHSFGARAKQRLSEGRRQIAAVVDAQPAEVIFTSGATEANNIALLGLERYGVERNRRHVISTMIEHKAVLEPLEVLGRRGFEVELVGVGAEGCASAEEIASRVRPDTLVVSMMAANNETGVIQPLGKLCELLTDSEVLLHADAAQSFGKGDAALRLPRIDLISASAHKLYGPKGIGALVARSRGGVRAPLAPLMFGGGQERGLRPGTAPVALIAAFGVACELALKDRESRAVANAAHRAGAMTLAEALGAEINGDPESMLETTLNLSVPGVDSEAAMLVLKTHAAISNGSACTSQSYAPSHVLEAMGLDPERASSALRISWSHLTPEVDWHTLEAALAPLAQRS